MGDSPFYDEKLNVSLSTKLTLYHLHVGALIVVKILLEVSISFFLPIHEIHILFSTVFIHKSGCMFDLMVFTNLVLLPFMGNPKIFLQLIQSNGKQGKVLVEFCRSTYHLYLYQFCVKVTHIYFD